MRDSSLMRDTLYKVPLARAHSRWRTLERGWRATALGLGVVTALAVLGP